MEFVIIFLLILCLVLSFLAYTSTNSKKRGLFLGITIGVYLLSISIEALYFFSTETELKFDLLDSYYGYVIGLILSMLIAIIVNQNRIEAPVVFVKPRGRYLVAGLSLVFLIYITIIMTLPNRYSINDWSPIYDIEYYRSLIPKLILIIPVYILLIIFTLQRTAFCENVFFHNGFLYHWESFERYSWDKNKLVLEEYGRGWVSIRIPDEKKETVEVFMNSRFDPDYSSSSGDLTSENVE